MAFTLADRVRETSTSTGTGTITLAGAVTGYQSFSAIGNGNNTYYCIFNTGTTEWEVGVGTYTSSGTTLSRDTVLASSNSGSLVNFSAGTKDVFVTYPAGRSVNYNTAGTSVALTGTLSATGLTNSGLTSGRVVYSTTGGAQTDSANLTFSGSTLAITGNLTATTDSTFSSTGALTISKGTTAQQPGSPATGMIRYNTTTNQFEGYSGSSPAWKSIGGSALSNDTTTASDYYPLFATATTGTAENVYTSNAKLLYKPSTGELKVSAPVATNGIVVNSATVAASYTIASGQNGFSVGPVTVSSGVTVTVTSGQKWVVI